MNRKIIIVISVVLFLSGIFILYKNFSTQKVTPADVVSSSDIPSKLETKTNEGGNVTIVVTPIDISPQSKEWKFDVGMNTHVVELDQDMLKIASLVDENGREYKPLNWDGPIGGHHREGILTFKPITSPYKIIQLKIAGVGGVIRVFTW